MKQLIAAFLVLLFNIASFTAINAQCEKRLFLLSSKTEYLDASGAVQKTVDEVTGIAITDKLLPFPLSANAA